jgi:hypothetical protein
MEMHSGGALTPPVTSSKKFRGGILEFWNSPGVLPPSLYCNICGVWEEREVGLGDIVWNFGSLLILKA